jgi:hypothetical protein
MIKLKDILNEVDPKTVFQKSVFTDPNNTHFLPRSKKLAVLQNSDLETNTKKEDGILDTLIGWINTGLSGTSKSVVNRLYSNFELFKSASKIYPKIFLPTKSNGTSVFRGISSPSSLLQNEVYWEIHPEKWSPYEINGWFISSIPVYYQPRLKVQSWTYDFEVSTQFADDVGEKIILTTKQDDDFLFSDAAMEIISGKNYQEHEILHFGQSFDNEIYPIVDKNAMDYIISNHKDRKIWKPGGSDTSL